MPACEVRLRMVHMPQMDRVAACADLGDEPGECTVSVRFAGVLSQAAQLVMSFS